MPKLLIIAHRGASGSAFENTLPAFQMALDIGADMIEFDVHACKSGELMVIHDFSVNRTTNGKGAINQLTYDQLAELKIGQQEKIPLLSEVLDLVDSQVPVNIEIKGKNVAGK